VFLVIDFNQVRELKFTESRVLLFLDAFFANEAYFLPARHADSLYNVFPKFTSRNAIRLERS
jgi:hypothetical protein